MKKASILLTVFAIVTITSCSSCATGNEIKGKATDVFKCVTQYPADAIIQTVSLVEKLGGTEGFVENLMAWAEGAKDSKFAMCVLTAVVKTKSMVPSVAETHQSLMIPADGLAEAVEKFRKTHFGNTVFEVPNTNQ